ncbi:hypothetical protein AB1Y20_003431 [Prymnesium parvum]|uniref:Uncharacterized protein n=1 Tax=Prymnesium parvum TaxID=97485 RepID=A0AB34JBZ8_PRYPA
MGAEEARCIALRAAATSKEALERIEETRDEFREKVKVLQENVSNVEKRVHQRAVQLYDVNHARKAGDAYKGHQMGLEDWRINLEGVAVLQPIADWTQYLQGTKYPTMPLVLADHVGYELLPTEMHAGVLAARTAMYDDWVSRWVTNIDPEAWALAELRCEWKTAWKPQPTEPIPDGAPGTSTDAEPPASDAVALPLAGEPPKKHRKVSLGSLLSGRVKKDATVVAPAAPPVP